MPHPPVEFGPFVLLTGQVDVTVVHRRIIVIRHHIDEFISGSLSRKLRTERHFIMLKPVIRCSLNRTSYSINIEPKLSARYGLDDRRQIAWNGNDTLALEPGFFSKFPTGRAARCDGQHVQNTHQVSLWPWIVRSRSASCQIEAEHPLPDGPWVLNRRGLETGTAAQLVERARGHKRAPALAVHNQGLLDLSVT